MTWAYSDGTKGRKIGRVEDEEGDRFVVYVELDHVVTQEWVNEHFPSEHCQHDYDCCGGWYPHRGRLVGVDDIYATSVISQSFHLNI